MIDMGISGAQTGVDQAWLAACAKHHVPTGGWMPKGFRTEDGPRPDLALRFGLQECPESGYPPRTRRNVAMSDAVLIIGNLNSRGSKLTRSLALSIHGQGFLGWRGLRCVSWPTGYYGAPLVVDWLRKVAPGRLMVAGNRESGNPGIGEAAFDLLDRVLAQLARMPAEGGR